MPYVIIALLIIYILFTKFKFPTNSIKIQEKLPYQKNNYLLSKAENNFYKVLSVAIKDMDLYICPKVRLADIIHIGKTEKRQSYWNKIQSKHIDFLLCKDNYFNPLIAIELDDSSHKKSNRVERDEFLNKALESANLPLLRIKANYSYSPNEIKEKIDGLLNHGNTKVDSEI